MRRYLLLPFLLALPASLKAWSVAAWNQHRKSSYYQKDCLWVSRLQQRGHRKKDIMDAIQRLEVYYSPHELQRWVADHDIVAVQEADPLFLEALGDAGGSIIHGEDDRDGRGIQVQSCTAIILPKARCLRKESAVLSFRLRRALVSRDHSIALVEHDGQQLVVCSVHLHPPEMISKAMQYTKYLEPLEQAVTSLAGVNKDGKVQTPCLLLGDFNIAPEQFRQMTSMTSGFWGQFQVVQPAGGATAHLSNPCEWGDFALATGGAWQGRALGSDTFHAFETYAARIEKVLAEDILMEGYKQAEQCCQDAKEWLLRSPSSSKSKVESLEHLSHARVALQRASRQLGRKPLLRRTLLNSDHRPLYFNSVIADAPKSPGCQDTLSNPYQLSQYWPKRLGDFLRLQLRVTYIDLEMAPKKGTKRAAEVVETPEAKKMKATLSKYGVDKSIYDGVVEAIQFADDVPNSVRQMLIAMLPEGICVPADMRHEYQNAHVKMILEVLQGVLSKLQDGVTSAAGEVARIEAAKSELQAKVQEAEAALEKADEVESTTKGNLAEVTRAVLACKSALAEKEKERCEGDAAHEAAKEEKAVIEQALANEFRLLRDGEVEGEDAKAHYKKLEALAGKIGFEASLMTALPTSILKKPADRGSFDAMVVAQLQEGLGRRLSQLSDTIAGGEPAAAARLAAVEQAKKELEVAKGKQQDFADQYRAAKEAQKDAQGAKKNAETKVKQTEPDLKAAKKIQQDAKASLENYQNYNWGSFEMLRDHTSKPKSVEAAQVQLEEAAAIEAAEAGA